MERYNDTNTPMLALVGFVGAILVVALIAGLQVLYYVTVEKERQTKVIDVATAESDSVVAEQEIKLAQYGWLDRKENKVAIPIERAMQLVVADLQQPADKERSDER
ncbi:MAG: hypothetical protein JJ992_03215 [Planctomycetes bacterium]|nr:hypothetical protein [Planctomycetota bacterium]